jgi:CheY-like chemotaxis protein
VNTKTTVLVIEDDVAIREMLRDTLELEGYHVVCARNGVEGLHAATRIRCDVIVVDMYMPLMDGRTFLSTYQRKPIAHAPVIVTSAQRIDLSTLTGVAGFIRKPFDIVNLLDTVEQALFRRNAASA